MAHIGTTSRPILPCDFGKFQTNLTKRRIAVSLTSLINYICVTNNKNLKCTYHSSEVQLNYAPMSSAVVIYV